jgi:hypothetical protein
MIPVARKRAKGIVSIESVIKPTWRDRLRVLFGSPVVLTAEVMCQFNPGNTLGEGRIVIPRLFGKEEG